MAACGKVELPMCIIEKSLREQPHHSKPKWTWLVNRWKWYWYSLGRIFSCARWNPISSCGCTRKCEVGSCSCVDTGLQCTDACHSRECGNMPDDVLSRELDDDEDNDDDWNKTLLFCYLYFTNRVSTQCIYKAKSVWLKIFYRSAVYFTDQLAQ